MSKAATSSAHYYGYSRGTLNSGLPAVFCNWAEQLLLQHADTLLLNVHTLIVIHVVPVH